MPLNDTKYTCTLIRNLFIYLALAVYFVQPLHDDVSSSILLCRNEEDCCIKRVYITSIYW